MGVRVLLAEILRSVVGKHETCMVLGVGSNPTVRNSRGDSLKTHSLGDLRMPSKIGGVKKE